MLRNSASSSVSPDVAPRGAIINMDNIGVDIGSPHPPALPPRPPPRPRPGVCTTSASITHTPSTVICCHTLQGVELGISSPPTPAHYEPPPERCEQNATSQQHSSVTGSSGMAVASSAVPHSNAPRRQCWSAALRKYVILCTACGGMAALLGALFLLVHFVLRANTSSLHYFETVPTYVPAVMLTMTGLVVMCFARRKNRYGYLIKVCGVCCLLCAVLCVVVTVTTTVIHMNRLQTLRECVYTQKTQACTCYSGLVQEPPALPSSPIIEDGIRFVFHNTPDCEVVHGALYSCLRALFGLSVIGILVCIFSCMLVYQLLSHEKKKMYWEQLEMRCRYLYGRRNPQYAYCGCSCDECPRFPPPTSTSTTPHTEMFTWPQWEQAAYLDDRYWNPPRVGNLYTPSPDEQNTASGQQPPNNSSGGGHNARWSWLPWNRSGANTTAAVSNSGTNCAIRAEQRTTVSEHERRVDPDSQYGFGANPSRGLIQHPPRGAQIVPVCRPLAAAAFVTETSGNSGSASTGSAGLLPRYLWGPPPPYSQPPSSSNSSATSPVRMIPDPTAQQPLSLYPRHHHGHHHHIQHVHHVATTPLHHVHHHYEQSHSGSHPNSPQHRASNSDTNTPSMTGRHSCASSPCCARIRPEDIQAIKSLTELPSSGNGGNNTLPLRKPKKRPSDTTVAVVGVKTNEGTTPQTVCDAISGSDSPSRKSVGLATSLRGLFGSVPGSPGPIPAPRLIPQSAPTSALNSPHKTALRTTSPVSPLRRLPPTPCVLVPATSRPLEATESEVYFADVSSCNGGPDSSLYEEPNMNGKEPINRLGDVESVQYVSIPCPTPPHGACLRRPRYVERLAPDAQYEARDQNNPPAAEDDAPMRDSDATIDSGVHSGSELPLQGPSRIRPSAIRAQELIQADHNSQQQIISTSRSVNV